MQKRSHKLLASMLLQSQHGFAARRYELAFLFGSFQPDCNPLSYLKGSLRARKFRGHNFSNSQLYINAHIARLRQCRSWTTWQYYTLGKLTHYLADAFTFPHNDTYTDSLMAHRRYEHDLRLYLSSNLDRTVLRPAEATADPAAAIDRLHRQYLTATSDWQRDMRYILRANGLLLACLLPQAL